MLGVAISLTNVALYSLAVKLTTDVAFKEE